MKPDCCKCIHRKVCPLYLDNLNWSTICTDYKDEDSIIESPVAIGSTLYLRVMTDKKDPSKFFINPLKVTGLHLKDEEGFRGISRKQYFIVRSEYGLANHIPFDWIGKKVFLTEDEAKEGGKYYDRT